MYQNKSKQSARKYPVFKTKERESKQSFREDPVLRLNKLCIKMNQSNLHEETLFLKQKKENQSSLLEKILFLRLKK